MRAKRLPFPIREQVQVFYEAKLSGSERKVVDQTVIIADLQPAPIATELVQILYAEIIERVPIFSQLDPEVIVKLCMLLQPIPALSGCPGRCLYASSSVHFSGVHASVFYYLAYQCG